MDLDDLRKAVQSRNIKILHAFQKELEQSSLSLKIIEKYHSAIATFAQTHLLDEDPLRDLLDLTIVES